MDFEEKRKLNWKWLHLLLKKKKFFFSFVRLLHPPKELYFHVVAISIFLFFTLAKLFMSLFCCINTVNKTSILKRYFDGYFFFKYENMEKVPNNVISESELIQIFFLLLIFFLIICNNILFAFWRPRLSSLEFHFEFYTTCKFSFLLDKIIILDYFIWLLNFTSSRT